ncbi:hypothetical protein N7501_005214 [Penicillium viridicatum]|nr:hypothetical protein N7501_005214 [Penicillium viridicatum]
MFSVNATDLSHSIGYREASSGEFVPQEALRAGQANVLVCLDVLTNDKFAEEMKNELIIEAMKEAGRWEA